MLKETQVQVFSCEVCEVFYNNIVLNTKERLLKV